jgi:hypothetical protein
MKTIKLSTILLFATCLVVRAETEEQVSKRFTVQTGGKLVVDVDFGTIDVSTNDTSEVTVDVTRKVTRSTKDEEEAFLADHALSFSTEGNTVTISSKAESRANGGSRGRQRTEGKYTITVPIQFSAELKTGGGVITVNDLTGEVNAATRGGNLQFARLLGPLDGRTLGGSIRVLNCEGAQQVKTAGGDIDLSGGGGSFEGKTSGGAVKVKDFRGTVQVKTGGGAIAVENVAGKLEGATAGGSISGSFASLSDEVKLVTSGGGVTFRVPENAAFDLDASTSGGTVSSDLSVDSEGKPSRNHLKGPVNGGGKPVNLHSSGGSIRVQKL